MSKLFFQYHTTRAGTLMTVPVETIRYPGKNYDVYRAESGKRYAEFGGFAYAFYGEGEQTAIRRLGSFVGLNTIEQVVAVQNSVATRRAASRS